MTMATVAYKQGIILERFWTALRLRRSKGPRETNNLIKFRSGGLKLTCYASHIAILCPRCNSIPHAVDSCLVEAARLRRSGAEWDASFEEAGVEDALHVGAVGCQVRPSGAAAAPTPTPVLGAAAPGIT